jgi:hypothetical protein
VRRKTAALWVRLGKIPPPVVPGRKARWSKKQINAFLAGRPAGGAA